MNSSIISIFRRLNLIHLDPIAKYQYFLEMVNVPMKIMLKNVNLMAETVVFEEKVMKK